MTLKSLVDSGSSNSFIDSAFIQTQHLPAYNILPIKLHLIDGTSNSVISQALDLQIQFPTGESQNLTFYVTLLDQSCIIVLGYHWLTHYNPLMTGYWAVSFSGNCRSMAPRHQPPSRHFHHWHHSQNLRNLSWIFQILFCW